MRELQIEFDIKDENVVYTMNQSRPELSFDVEITANKDEKLKELLMTKANNNLVSTEKAALIFFPTVNRKDNGAYPKLKLIRELLKDEKVGLFTVGEPKDDPRAREKHYNKFGLKNINNDKENIRCL